VNRLTYKREHDRAGWLEVVKAALGRHPRIPAAALALGVPQSTLARWVGEEDELQAARGEVPRGWNAWTPESRARARKKTRKKGPSKKK
jgi:hypothetical protein